MTFGPDGKLYLVIGDPNRDGQLQNFSGGQGPDNTGVIFRINDDVSAPGDNPFSSQADLAKYFAYGIRNSLVWPSIPLQASYGTPRMGPTPTTKSTSFGPDSPAVGSGSWVQSIGVLKESAISFSSRVLNMLIPIFPGTIPPDRPPSCFLTQASGAAEYQDDVFVGDINNGHLYHFKPNATRHGFLFADPGLADLVADDAGEVEEVILGTNFGGMSYLEVGARRLSLHSSFSEGKIFVVSPAAGFAPSATPLVNLSTRSIGQTGDNVMIGGFVIKGMRQKPFWCADEARRCQEHLSLFRVC